MRAVVSAPQPSTSEAARLAAVAASLSGIGLQHWQQAGDFVVWSAQLAANVIRWRAGGLTFVIRRTGRRWQSVDLPLDAVGAIGISVPARTRGRYDVALLSEEQLTESILAHDTRTDALVIEALEQLVALGVEAAGASAFGLAGRWGGVRPVRIAGSGGLASSTRDQRP